MNDKVNMVNNLEYKVLVVIVHSFGASLFDIQSFLELEIKDVYAKSEKKLALLKLCEKKMVLRLRKVAGEITYCVPFKIYIDHMTGFSKANLPQLTPLEHVEESSELVQQDLVMDLIILLGWIAREQPKLNKKGQIDKKLIELILQHVHLTPDCLKELVSQEATKHSYPISLSILLDLGMRLGVIHMAEGQLRMNSEQVTHWLKLAPIEMRLKLYNLWFIVHYPEQLELRQLLISLPLLPYSQWFSVEDLFEWIQSNLHKANIMVEIDQLRLESFLLAIQELGWIQLGQDTEGKQAIRSLIGQKSVKYVENNADYWFVQPDYEIVAPKQINYDDHYQFNMYTTLQSRNLMCTYRITKDSIIAAFELGWTKEDVMKHLGSYAKYGIPESIQISIMEWDQQYRGIQLEDAMLLRCDTIATAEQMMLIPEIENVLNEQSRIGPKVFLIPEEHVSFIREKMNAFGYRTNTVDKKRFNNYATISSSSRDELRSDELEISKGIFHSKIRYDMYTQDEQNYTVESVYPGLSKIPSNWLYTYATYHLSTRIKLIQQAIDWQCYVLTALSGENVLLAPSSLIHGDTIPQVEAMYCDEKLIMGIDQLETIQLIVPGVHDAIKYMSTIE